MSNKAENVDFGLFKMVYYIVAATLISALGVASSLMFNETINVIDVCIKIGLLVVAFLVRRILHLLL